MKTFTTVVSTIVLLTVVGASAQADTETDGIGVYFDMMGVETCHYTVIPFEQVTAYLCITNLSDPAGVSGWEATVLSVGPAVAPAWTLTAGLDVDMTAEGFQVGIGVEPLALPPSTAVVLATWAGYMMAPMDVQEFTVMDIPGSVSFAGTPGYASGSDAGLLIPLQVSTGFPYIVCAQINACDVVANAEMSWSSVKTLYR